MTRPHRKIEAPPNGDMPDRALETLRLGVIGGGPVGLVTAAGFCSLGHEVICVEKDIHRLERLTGGTIPFFEPELQELVEQGVDQGRLRFTASLREVMRFATVILICVGTPEGKHGAADMSQVEEAAASIAAELPGYRLLIEKSTVPIGSHRRISRIIQERAGSKADFDVACIPEFLREGNAVHDFFKPDRVIIGAVGERSRYLLEQLYGRFDCPKIWTDPGTAELSKHASNAFLALKISYANLLSDVSEATGADLDKLLQGVGGDPRVGPSFLNPGAGYGGSCLPKDVQAFYHLSTEVGVDASLLAEAQKINRRRPDLMVEKALRGLDPVNERLTTVWGLSFKPGTDDVRRAPSLEVVRQLLNAGARVVCHDPVAIARFQDTFGDHPRLDYHHDMYQAAANSHAALIVTEWDEYRNADLDRLKAKMAVPLIVDGRRVFDPQKMKLLGFDYQALGTAGPSEN